MLAGFGGGWTPAGSLAHKEIKARSGTPPASDIYLTTDNMIELFSTGFRARCAAG